METPPPPPWLDLPRELTAKILQRQSLKDIFRSELVCTTWLNVCRDPSFWRFVDLDNSIEGNNLDRISRKVVDRSNGELVSIKLGGTASNNLLLYIARRAKQLRSLSISIPYYISEEGFLRAIKEMPKLEELELTYLNISIKGIEVAGNSCPLLESFSITRDGSLFTPPKPSDEEAHVIAANMRGLKSLKLYRNGITDRGVKAILDACPHLQTLYLLNCYNVGFEGDLKERCSQQIEDLKHTRKPTGC